MFLSKLVIDPKHPQARRELGDVYEMHRTLVRAFAPDAVTPPPRFLWRLEPSSNHDADAIVLVQSSIKGNWAFMQSPRGSAIAIHANKQVDLNRCIRSDSLYRFRILANPSVCRNGKRIALLGEDEQVKWFTEQGEKHGFKPKSVIRLTSGRLATHRGKAGDRITVGTALLEGILLVSDVEALRHAVRAGLGHGKAWGLGLLSLAPFVSHD